VFVEDFATGNLSGGVERYTTTSTPAIVNNSVNDITTTVLPDAPTDPATGAAVKLIDVSQTPGNDSGGAGGVSTAGDYLRFCQAMLDGGQLDGARIVSRTTVRLMTSDHLGSAIATPVSPGQLLLGTPGYTFGLGFLVRQGDGVAAVHGSAGEFMWAGYAGTYFWADPKEQTCAVLMTQSSGPSRVVYRRMMKALVSQSLMD
jgi:CubicO group peptidase (beta-lactamase class C family)